MPMPTPITIATANPGKVAELRPIFAVLEPQVFSEPTNLSIRVFL